MSNALRGGEAPLKALLDKYPDLVNEISTGGATPLHMCGMGRDNERSTQYIIDRGGEIEVNIKTLTTFRPTRIIRHLCQTSFSVSIAVPGNPNLP